MAIKIGVNHKDFMEMTPYIFSIYLHEYNERKKQEAEMIEYTAWIYGAYTSHAIMATIGNSSWFKDKKAKAHEYPKNPIADKYQHKYEENMSEEEKKKQTELLFAKLNVMKTNFEIAHK